MIAKNTYHNPEIFNTGFGIHIDFSDDKFLKKFNKAKMTMFRLASKGELFKIRALSHHKGFGNYEYIILDADCWRKKHTDVNIPLSVFDGKQTTIKVFLTNDYGKTFFNGKIEMSERTFNLYAMSPYGKMELVYEGNKAKEAANEDARRTEWKNLNVLEVLAWQEYNEYVSTYQKRLFEKEIIDWQVKHIKQIRENNKEFIHASLWMKINKLVKQGRYLEAKRLIRVAVDYKFTQNISCGSSSENSKRQLRALGFVA